MILNRISLIQPFLSVLRGVSKFNKTSIQANNLMKHIPNQDSSNCFIIVRNYIPPDFPKPKIALKFRAIDKIPPNYELIYRLHFPNYLIAIQVVNFSGLLLVVMLVLSLLFPDNDSKKPFPESTASSESEQTVLFGLLKEVKKENPGLPTPQPTDMYKSGKLEWESVLVMVVGLVSIGIALFRLQRMIPIRLYTSPSGHSYAVYHGHIIPSMTNKREFVAGTIKSVKQSSGFLGSVALFEDATRRKMVLFDHSFRYPADMNYILGIKGKKDNDDSSSTGSS